MLEEKYNYEKIVRIGGLRKTDLFQYFKNNSSFTHLLVPCNTGGHWVLLVVDFIEKKFIYFDSYWDYSLGVRDDVIDNVERFLKEHWEKTMEKGNNFPFFKRKIPLGKIPHQKDHSSNCGPFVCMFGRWIMLHSVLDKDNENDPFLKCKQISYFRFWMKEEFQEGALLSFRLRKESEGENEEENEENEETEEEN